ncbi:MAG: NAD-dependent epimerase/dehydratase family protein, partial [Candidatus Dormibacteraeota bacterium]|nr:NAD-dependent epimerase/dehydratase family protein [Candidatus Dormibacteraeota bacterium]
MADTVFLTGATGFVGGHVLEALVERGYRVRALVRNGNGDLIADRAEIVHGSLLATGALVPHLRGCRYVVHTAALYSFAPRDRRRMRQSTINGTSALFSYAPKHRTRMEQVNVGGTAGLLEAARIAGIERAVVTSSSAAVGPARDGRPADENDWGDPHHGGAYHASKIVQERTALAGRIPVVTVLPTAPLGARDRTPTPTGRMVLDIMRGRVPAYLGGGMNVVPVRDAAQAHVLALERGIPRERYLAGGVNLSLAELFALVAGAADRPAPRLRLPYPLAVVAAAVDEARAAVIGGTPTIPME